MWLRNQVSWRDFQLFVHTRMVFWSISKINLRLPKDYMTIGIARRLCEYFEDLLIEESHIVIVFDDDDGSDMESWLLTLPSRFPSFSCTEHNYYMGKVHKGWSMDTHKYEKTQLE